MKTKALKTYRLLKSIGSVLFIGATVLFLCFETSFSSFAQTISLKVSEREDKPLTHEADAVSEEITDVSLPVSENADEQASVSEAREKASSPKKRDVGVVFEEYQRKIEELAQKCEELGMPLEAKVTRSLIYPDNSEYYTVPLFPKTEALKRLPEDASKNQRYWYEALRKLRVQYSEEVFSYALRYGEKKRGYDVVACMFTTLFINPEHVKARNFFNYTLQNGFWRSKWELRQLEKGLVDTPEFGWIPEDNVKRYRKGERFYKNQWISAEEESKRIVASASGWRVETEHFSILSRVSLERGVEIGRFLEAYYEAWSRLFYRIIAAENQWNSRLYVDSEIVSKRHKVILYRNRDEYLRELKKHDSNVSYSVGGYFPNMRCIFVYEPGDDDDFELFPLLAHETTHQLFEECSTSSQNRFKVDFNSRAKTANFWAIEGIAVYAETFNVNKARTSATLGGYKDVFRIQCALESLFETEDYVPLREYAGLSREKFQNRRDIATLYSQAAGLAFFFMHYKDGEYRNAFVSYLYNIYQGIDNPDSLEKATGKTFEELDKEYEDFMRSIYQTSK